MTRFLWVRHGPTHAKSMVGWTDIPADLSDGAALGRLGLLLPPDALILSSDLIRARMTADALQGGRTRLPDRMALRELHFGAWEQQGFAEVEAHSPEHIRAFWDTPGDIRAPGGESWNDVVARVGATVEDLILMHADRTVVVVAHFGSILAALQVALQGTAQEVLAHRIDNLSLTELTCGSEGWTVGRINHLA